MFNELSSKTLKLYEKYSEKFPGVNYEHFTALGNCGWYGLYLSEKEIVDILEKFKLSCRVTSVNMNII